VASRPFFCVTDLRPDPETRYEVVDLVLATIKSEHAEKMRFVGNERYMNI
jgi:hypothetical protein